MNKSVLKLTITLLSLAAVSATAQTAATPAAPPTAPPPPVPPVSAFDAWANPVKNPADWFTWGADLRIRNEYFNDLLTLNPHAALHEQDYFRFRSRLWLGLTPVTNLSLNARIATEPREWMDPAGYTPFARHTGVDMTEGLIDNLNVKWKNLLGQPATLLVGRQDILLGDGWLTGDGTPMDGSWTYFLDAARLTYELKEQHTTIDAIGIIQDAQDDGWLPTLNNQDRFVTEQDEKGAILYVNNTSLKAANLSGYFIYKHDNAANRIAAKYRPDSGDIYTLGARVSGLVADHWKYSAEGAYQFGQKKDRSDVFPSPTTGYRDLSAFGLTTKAAYLFQDKLNDQLSFSYEFLSGDDPKTKNDEMFDNLWGRWPRWSEIGLYTFAPETRIGQEANIHRLGPSWSCNPIKNMDFSASYYALFAEEDVATRAPASLFSGTGNFRGHFVQGVLKYRFNPHLTGHLWSEALLPGDYYVHKAMMTFLRAEVLFTF